MNKIVVIVDAFSTGKYLAPEINKRGYECVHVKSRADVPSYFTEGYRSEDFLDEFVFNNNMQELDSFLSKYSVIAVMNGTETGVELTDLLALSLKVPGNKPSSSHLRRNKFDMIEAIRKAGLYAARQYVSENIDEILNWYHSNFTHGERIVIKPVNSAGTDNVIFCHDENEIKNAAAAILSQVNRLGLKNKMVLAQSYLDGCDEYVVNTVSHDGNHHITDIWHCDKVYISGFVLARKTESSKPK